MTPPTSSETVPLSRGIGSLSRPTLPERYRRYECQRNGHLWVGTGYGRRVVHDECRRCGRKRTVIR